MTRVGTIAALTCKEAVRRRLLAAALALGVLFLVMYALGLWVLRTDATLRGLPNNLVWRSQATATLTAMGLYAVNWLLALMSILMAVDTLSGEISSGAMQLVVAKPLHRWEVVLGKWIGYAVLIFGYLLLMAGGVLADTWLILGHRPVRVAQTLGLMTLENLLLLSITMRAGASLSTMATGACVFGMHILAFLGGWIEEFGALSHSTTAVNLGVSISLACHGGALATGRIRNPRPRGRGIRPHGVRRRIGSQPMDGDLRRGLSGSGDVLGGAPVHGCAGANRRRAMPVRCLHDSPFTGAHHLRSRHESTRKGCLCQTRK